jgi:hypothetical protein
MNTEQPKLFWKFTKSSHEIIEKVSVKSSKIKCQIALVWDKKNKIATKVRSFIKLL